MKNLCLISVCIQFSRVEKLKFNYFQISQYRFARKVLLNEQLRMSSPEVSKMTQDGPSSPGQTSPPLSPEEEQKIRKLEKEIAEMKEELKRLKLKLRNVRRVQLQRLLPRRHGGG